MKTKLIITAFILLIPFFSKAQFDFFKAPSAEIGDLRTAIKFDMFNLFDNNPALLFEYGHPLVKRWRLSHELGPIFKVEAYDRNSTLGRSDAGLRGFKFREEIKYVLDNKNYGKHPYFGLALMYRYYGLRSVDFVERMTIGNTSFFQQGQGNFAQRKYGFLITLGVLSTVNDPFIIDYGIGFGFQSLKNKSIQNADTEDLSQTLNPLSAEDSFYSFRIKLQIGFMPKKKKEVTE